MEIRSGEQNVVHKESIGGMTVKSLRSAVAPEG